VNLRNLRLALVGLAAPFFFLGAAQDAAASTEPEAPATPPKFSKIPVGRMTTMPQRGRPAGVPRRESVPGIYPVLAQWAAHAPPRERSIVVTADPRQAEALRTGAEYQGERDGGACFADARGVLFGNLAGSDVANVEWGSGGSFSAETQVSPKNADDPSSGVAAVHVERVIDQGGGASLESTDAWVDPATQGARLIARSVVPLVLAGTASGTKVFVGRDERPDGKRLLQVVFVPPSSMPAAAAKAFTRQAWARSPRGTTHATCGHVRVALTLASGEEANDHAVFQAPILLGTAPAVATEQARGPLQELRLRNVEVQASISKVTKDPEPVVSISFAWAGREQTRLAPAGS
jgi:hypothetical protein